MPLHPFGPVIRQPALGRHTGSVILLHGLGDTGDGWAPVGPQLRLPHIKFVYPTAPTRPITVNMGMKMPGWFDISHLDQAGLQDMMKGKPFDPQGTAEAVEHVGGLIAEEVAAGIPLNRIVVGGFSQGGHVAYKTALTHPDPLGGCIALSTWLEPSLKDVPAANLAIPFFCGHGSVDNLIPPVIATTTQGVLEGMGCSNVEFHMYTGMGHSSCPQELRDVREWLLKVLPDNPPTREEVRAMSGAQLKAFLRAKGVDTRGMLEKGEMVEAALAALQLVALLPAPRSGLPRPADFADAAETFIQLSAMVVRLGKLDAVVKRQTGLPVATQAFVSRSARLLGIAAHAACGMPEAGRQLATDVGAAAAACMAGSWMVVLRHLSAQEPARAAVEAGVMLACCARVLQALEALGTAGAAALIREEAALDWLSYASASLNLVIGVHSVITPAAGLAALKPLKRLATVWHRILRLGSSKLRNGW
ncbi:acyl-thioesterase 2 [Micractinium conductrix]|uniref:Acyl-thioesterase 2 n=1 Tax=Micractinium conductrix TaxID=554055 RepID=A0A2P6VS03_9CHLO|nr:acyl-thioesterase 2 [Micractinium conductrix]|eukprot:PSC76869.1 acyl-thioesterase 2 [Micractinium conductrix]